MLASYTSPQKTHEVFLFALKSAKFLLLQRSNGDDVQTAQFLYCATAVTKRKMMRNRKCLCPLQQDAA